MEQASTWSARKLSRDARAHVSKLHAKQLKMVSTRVSKVATLPSKRAAAPLHSKRAVATPRNVDTSQPAKKARSSSGALDAGEKAAAHLIAADKRFQSMIQTHGLLTLGAVKSQPTAFSALLKTIVYQQLASRAAATIHSRLITAVKADPPTPAAVLAAPLADLRGAGLSERKVSYIVDLASHFNDGRLSDELLQTASDDELLRALTAVKGIGPWSCHSFMIFQLCRPDVLPVNDHCVQKGMATFFGLDTMKRPTPALLEELSRLWSPYRSYASYYLWLDAKRSDRNQAS